MDRAERWSMLRLAVRLAREAGRLALSRFGRAEAVQKHDHSMVTDVDREIERRVMEAVARAFPDHAVLGEEHHREARLHNDPRSTSVVWVVDPLDGTRNYVAGFPCFATSIGVLETGRPVVGVVYEHNLGLLYTAVEGEGAWMRRVAPESAEHTETPSKASSEIGGPSFPLRARTENSDPARAEARDSEYDDEKRSPGATRLGVVDPPEGGDVLVGAPSNKDPLTVAVLSRWLATPGIVYRNVGSTAVQLALVASGVLAAAFAKRCKIWDMAAGALLVTEAGGRFTDPAGKERIPFELDLDPETDRPILAGAPRAHRRLVASIADLTGA